MIYETCACLYQQPLVGTKVYVPVIPLTAIIDNVITLQPKKQPTADTEEAPAESSVYTEPPLVPCSVLSTIMSSVSGTNMS
jgi:hypothetical protein